MEIIIEKEDWEKIKKDADNLVKEAIISLSIFRNTSKLAERNLMNFSEVNKVKETVTIKEKV